MSFNKKEEFKLTGLSADTDTDKIDLDEFLHYAAQFSWTNGAAFSATISLEGSNDGMNWATVPGSSIAISGASGTHIWDIGNSAVSFVRVAVSSVAGSADAEVDYNSKSIKFNR